LASVVLASLAVLLFSVLLSVLRSLVTFGNLVLSRRDDEGGQLPGGVLHLQHGLLRVREYTYDTARLRGGTIREPLLVRAFGGARLDAVMTGVAGAGEASLLLPPCPRATAETVLAEVIGPVGQVVAGGQLRGHGPAAVRRRWTRALALPVVLLVAVVGGSFFVSVAPWVWVMGGVLVICGGLLAHDRARALGHRAGDGWLVARSGSLERRRDCIAAGGIIGWTVRQTFFQRRAGVATLVAATAAGVKGYRVLDVPADLAWSVAALTTPWVADQEWARGRQLGGC
jgi:putative membrane protein